MTVINLTPHEVVIVDDEGNKVFEFKKSGTIARCVVDRIHFDDAVIGKYKIPINKTMFTAVQGLPDPKDGVQFIVSKPVAQAMKGMREDLLIPDATYRDNRGVILGCRGLAIIC